jgi:ABC-type transport system substrate-binding protein
MNDPRLVRRLGVGIFSLSMLLAACTSAAAPSASPAPASPSPDAPVSVAPSDGSGSGSAPSDGNLGGAKLVVPKPGQLDPQPVRADELVARVEGSSIIVTATWTSGVEPCYVLDQVVVEKGDGTYAITLREGHGPAEVMCIQIAEIHTTEITIPDVAPGTYQITDSTGGAAPIEVTVG